jgi:mono/diheme cytochrome c family protein
MPSWSDGLSDPEIHDLVTYLRTFRKKNSRAATAIRAALRAGNFF